MNRFYPLKGISVAIALFIFLLGPSCAPTAPSEAESANAPIPPSPGPRTDVLLITIDTLRADALGFAGHPNAQTPNLDALAQGGVQFENTYAHEVITLPSHASILTGLYPHEHGVRDNAGYRLGASIPTLASELKQAGYTTAAYVSAFTLDRRYGLDTGFDVYDDRYEGYAKPGFSPAERPADKTLELASAWWEANDTVQRFLWVHLFTPHFPYSPPEPFATQFKDSPYHGEVSATDAMLAPLLELVSKTDPSPLIIITSDHGESLGEHGEATHGVFAYDATLKVPLIIHWPNRLKPDQRKELVRHVDLLPTVLGLLDLPAVNPVSGRNLFAPVPQNHDLGSYFESLSPFLNRGWAPLFGRIEGHYKAIDLPIPELYNLEQDPQEQQNLALRDKQKFSALRKNLPADRLEIVRPTSVDTESIAKLRSLGYVSGSAPPPSDPWAEANDPKNLITLDSLLDTALSAANAGRTQEAEQALRSLIKKRPTMTVAYTHLAFLLTERGNLSEAIAVLSEGITAGAGNESMHRKLALALMRSGDFAGARAALEPFERSQDPETMSAWGRLEAGVGQWSLAKKRFQKALQIDPSYPGALTDQGVLALLQGDAEEARHWLEQALEADPYQPEAWNTLGTAFAQLRDFEQARAAWLEATDQDPNLTDAWFNLSLLSEQTNRIEDAVRYLTEYQQRVSPAERQKVAPRLRQLRAQLTP